MRGDYGAVGWGTYSYSQEGKDPYGSACYASMTEAFYYKKILMENDWDENALKKNITARIEMNLKLDLTKEYEVKLNYCPNCRRKLKINQEECPSCGINIKEYLYSN